MTSEKPKADRASWAPGEIVHGDGDIEINPGAQRLEMDILNTGDRAVQVGSHVHLPQANAALQFDREAAHGRRLDIPAGTAVRFEPGVAQHVSLVPLGGLREVHGLSLRPPGRLDPSPPGQLGAS
ncbi:MAG: urease subunit beta [Mycobacterium sp.]|jgi:urease subunit beta|nr:urease subunit beta [Mycobacterium sp.]